MWIPKNEAEIISVITSKSLEETATFDAKKEIPTKNIETAKDVSAMANSAGGVLIYGIDEDANGFPNVLNPIPLEGQRERIEAIIRTSIDEVPNVKISAIQTQADDSKGYLVIIVPPSERAHMVIVKGERRFYGRGETGNYILSQAEVARLYERRSFAEESILPILEGNIKQYPVEESSGLAHLHVVIKPVLTDDGILDKALLPGQTYNQFLNTSVAGIIESDIFSKPYEPDFYVRNWIRSADGFLSKMCEPSADNSEKFALYLEANFDGSGTMFCNRAAETMNQENERVKWFFSDIAAGNLAKFLALFGELYKKASYLGMVDIGVGLTGLENSFEYNTRNNFFGGNHRYGKPNYKRTTRVSAMFLEENPIQVASDLLMRLIDAVSQGKYNPFN